MFRKSKNKSIGVKHGETVTNRRLLVAGKLNAAWMQTSRWLRCGCDCASNDKSYSVGWKVWNSWKYDGEERKQFIMKWKKEGKYNRMKNKQNVLFYLEDHNFIQLPPSSLQATHHSVCWCLRPSKPNEPKEFIQVNIEHGGWDGTQDWRVTWTLLNKHVQTKSF